MSIHTNCPIQHVLTTRSIDPYAWTITTRKNSLKSIVVIYSILVVLESGSSSRTLALFARGMQLQESVNFLVGWTN
ncbi:hypothetical protein MTR67_044037 [Solanum verrucosum]|uniref:Uncharacterized protein n=1 Tax=Solanum verrucosum TaxID=315347 RepID=A0AAF0UQR6_SOLVR|nr:hypothetical protein MTR67_044037 [Solanum verrucosum]